VWKHGDHKTVGKEIFRTSTTVLRRYLSLVMVLGIA